MRVLLPLLLGLTTTSPATASETGSTTATLTYASPPKAAKPALGQHKLTLFAKDERVFVASDDVNLRAKPAADAAVVAKAPFGAEVRILERGARDEVSARVDHWYRVEVRAPGKAGVKSGWVFGGTLTPFVLRANLDEDTALEQVSASWSWRHAAVVRVQDDGKESARAEWLPGARWRGGRIEKLATHTASAAGIPLVELEVLIGDPDDGYRTYWRVFYAYRQAAGARVLEEVFSTYRNEDIDSRVRFDPSTKTAEVSFVRDGAVTSTERYPLTPRNARTKEAMSEHEHEHQHEPHGDHDCIVHVKELPPVLPAGTRVVREQEIVEEQALEGGRLLLRHGGCVHYTQVWSFVPADKKIPATVAGRLALAKEVLAPFEGAGPLLEPLERALAEKSHDARGGFPCGDAICSVEKGEVDGRAALVITYDFPL